MSSDISTSSDAFPRDYNTLAPLVSSAPFSDRSGDYSAPFALLRFGVLVLTFFLTVDASINQLQMLLFGGRSPITPAILKVALTGAFVAAFLLRGKIKTQPALSLALLLIVYLAVDALHQHFNLGIDFTDVLLSYNAYYVLPLIGVVALTVPVRISDRLLTGSLIVMAVICGALGIAQYIGNTPIVRTFSSDGNFKVRVWSSLGHLRVFSLFGEPAACAIFFCLIASLAVAMCNRKKNLFVAIPLLALSLFMSWASGARTNIVGTACGVASSYIITFTGRRDRTKWLPFMWLAIGLAIAFYAFSQAGSGGLSTGLMTDASSFSERIAIWSNIVDTLKSTSFLNLLCGYGIIQNDKIDVTGLGASDNVYLAIVLHTGIIGLTLVMLLFWQLWQLLRREAETRTSCFIIAVAATYSTLLLTGLFKLNFFGAMFLLFAISDKASPIRSLGDTGSTPGVWLR